MIDLQELDEQQCGILLDNLMAMDLEDFELFGHLWTSKRNWALDYKSIVDQLSFPNKTIKFELIK